MKLIIENSLLFMLFLICFLFQDYLMSFVPIKNQEKKIVCNINQSENLQLKKELKSINKINFQKYSEYDYEICKTIYRNPYYFFQSIKINCGKNKNIKKGDAVINEDGMVGVINKVNNNSSVVYLITNQKVTLSIMVNDFYGVLNGYRNGYFFGSKFSNQSLLNENDLVYTADLSNTKSHLLIGKIKRVRYDAYNVEQKVSIESKVNFSNINYVGVIK